MMVSYFAIKGKLNGGFFKYVHIFVGYSKALKQIFFFSSFLVSNEILDDF